MDMSDQNQMKARAQAQQALQALAGAAQQEESARQAGGGAMRWAIEQARGLAGQLAPLFPVIASATRTDGGFDAWCDSWARQILSNGLSGAEILGGLARFPEILSRAGNPPPSFSHFLAACRPDAHLTGQDAEARKSHPLLLTRDLKKDEGWCSARDACMATLRARGWKV